MCWRWGGGKGKNLYNCVIFQGLLSSHSTLLPLLSRIFSSFWAPVSAEHATEWSACRVLQYTGGPPIPYNVPLMEDNSAITFLMKMGWKHLSKWIGHLGQVSETGLSHWKWDRRWSPCRAACNIFAEGCAYHIHYIWRLCISSYITF